MNIIKEYLYNSIFSIFNTTPKCNNENIVLNFTFDVNFSNIRVVGYVDKNYEFCELCKKGNLSNIKKYYYDNQDTNIHYNCEEPFRECCKHGFLDVAKWLFDLSKNNKIGLINIHICNEETFRWCCYTKHLDVAKWLLDISTENKNELGLINIHAEDEWIFTHSCYNGDMAIAKWLFDTSLTYGVGIINIHAKTDKAFRCSCSMNHIEIAKWLIDISREYKLGEINIHADNEYIFSWNCFYFNTKTVEWIYSLDRGNFDVKCLNRQYDFFEYNDIIKKNLSLIRMIGHDYYNNRRIRNEYKREYRRWRLHIIIKVIPKIIRIYNNFINKTYSPKGIGFSKAKEDFYIKTNKIEFRNDNI